jgi:hypothetical protein
LNLGRRFRSKGCGLLQAKERRRLATGGGGAAVRRRRLAGEAKKRYGAQNNKVKAPK